MNVLVRRAISRYGVLLLLVSILGVRRSHAQTPPDSDLQTKNKQSIGSLIAGRPNRARDRQLGLSPTAVSQLKIMDDQIESMRQSGDPGMADMLQKRSFLLTHSVQEAWNQPNIDDQRPDPSVAAVMNQPNPAWNHVLLWNHAALDLTSIDYYLPQGADAAQYPYFGEQLGPPCTSRAMAIVHLAMFEALNAIRKGYPSYNPGGPTTIQQKIFADAAVSAPSLKGVTADESSAVRAAAYTALVAMYPGKAGYLNQVWNLPDIAQITQVLGTTSKGVTLGNAIGAAAANAVLAARATDGTRDPKNPAHCLTSKSKSPDDPILPVGPDHTQFQWRRDPLHRDQDTQLGDYWGSVAPFVLSSGSKYRLVAPDTTSDIFKQSFDLTRSLGGDPHVARDRSGNILQPTGVDSDSGLVSDHIADTAILRTPDQEQVGIFWAYDGTAELCAPPRLYNMIATSIATQEKLVTDELDMARLLALVNVALADAAIASWDSKYAIKFARPVTAIRRQVGKDNMTFAYPTWTPLGAQITNSETQNSTPNFPSYPSGHATFGGALFQVLRDFWKVDSTDTGTAFRFVSDEYNGFNADPKTGRNRPYQPRYFNTFSQAESENAMSRVYLGIHWKMDADDGVTLGHKVGADVDAGLYHMP